ncbi:hypothetical protein EON65_34250 [archaeon]|nr:MAG: hypothetical protein EON65_34250 [archaeon]
MNYSGIVVSTALLMLLWLHTLALPLWRHALDRKVRRVIDPSRILDSLLSKIGFSTVSFHPADPDQAMALVPLGYFAKYPGNYV